jgi:hypothetical protein
LLLVAAGCSVQVGVSVVMLLLMWVSKMLMIVKVYRNAGAGVGKHDTADHR